MLSGRDSQTALAPLLPLWQSRHLTLLSELAPVLAGFAAGLERLPNLPVVTLLAGSEFGSGACRKSRNPASGWVQTLPMATHTTLGGYPRVTL